MYLRLYLGPYSIARPFLNRKIIFFDILPFFSFQNALLRHTPQVTQDFEDCDRAFVPSARVEHRSKLLRQRLALLGRRGGTLFLNKSSCPLPTCPPFLRHTAATKQQDHTSECVCSELADHSTFLSKCTMPRFLDQPTRLLVSSDGTLLQQSL